MSTGRHVQRCKSVAISTTARKALGMMLETYFARKPAVKSAKYEALQKVQKKGTPRIRRGHPPVPQRDTSIGPLPQAEEAHGEREQSILELKDAPSRQPHSFGKGFRRLMIVIIQKNQKHTLPKASSSLFSLIHSPNPPAMYRDP